MRSVTCLLEVEAVLNVVRAHVDFDMGEVLVERPHAAVVGAWSKSHTPQKPAAEVDGIRDQSVLTDSA